MLAIAVIAISGSSGGAGGHAAAPSADSRALAVNGPRVPPENCPSVRKALRYYTAQYLHWTGLRVGAGTPVYQARPKSACPRYLLHIRKAKARAAHRAWNAYFHYHYAWSDWLPRLWYAIGMCETQLNWAHNSGTYQGAFGFWYGTWDSYKPRGAPSEAYNATPRQQYQAALNVAARVGLGAWGCYSHGGYRYHL